MNNKNTDKSTKGSQVLQQLISKSWDDPVFKNDLIANPINAIEEFTGKKMKPEFTNKVKVHDQTNSNIIYLNIPRKLSETELSDEKLEQVVGGIGDACYDFGNWLANGIEDIVESVSEAISNAPPTPPVYHSNF